MKTMESTAVIVVNATYLELESLPPFVNSLDKQHVSHSLLYQNRCHNCVVCYNCFLSVLISRKLRQ